MAFEFGVPFRQIRDPRCPEMYNHRGMPISLYNEGCRNCTYLLSSYMYWRIRVPSPVVAVAYDWSTG